MMDDAVLHVLSDLLNPWSAFWCWNTQSRFDMIAELLVGFHIGKEDIVATIEATVTFLVAVVIALWLF